jgi:O-antigen ligase
MASFEAIRMPKQQEPAIPRLWIAAWLLLLLVLAASVYAASELTVRLLVGVSIGIPVVRLLWRRPEFGLLGIIFLTSSFIPADVVDIRLPVGGLKVRDLALLGMLGLLMLRGWQRRKLDIPWWPVSRVLIIFLGFATFSLLYAILYKKVEPNWAFSEYRALFFYAGFFVAAWAIEQRRQVVIVLAGLFILSDLTALIVIAQQFLGTQNRLLAAMTGGNWRVWQSDVDSTVAGTVRVIPPGHVLMYTMMVIAFCLMVYARQERRLRMIMVFQFIFLNIALLLTYTRAEWLASALAIALIVAVLPRVDKLKCARYGLITIVVLFSCYGLAGASFAETINNSEFIRALTLRFSSILTPDETLGTDSLEWRIYENGTAIEAIARQPVLGVGLGNTYRDITLLQNNGADQGLGGSFRFTRYVHNSYLYIAVKLGIPGFLTLIWFCLVFLWHGWRAYSRLVDPQYKRLTLAILMSFVGLLTWAFSHSHLILEESTVVVGMMAGLISGLVAIEQHCKLPGMMPEMSEHE